MPVVSTTPYPSVSECLVAARVFANDAGLTIDGNILALDQPYVIPMVQSCYRKLQRRLRRGGKNTQSKYVEVHGLGPVQTPDTATQVQLRYTGYYDGVNLQPIPLLPPDLLEPLEVWERLTFSQQAWQPMMQAADSIQTRAQTLRFQIWDWEEDILYLPGATQSNDLKFKYLQMLPQPTSGDDQIFIADSQDAMGALIAEMAAKSRGGTEAAGIFHQDVEDEIQLLLAPTARKEQYAAFHRKPFRNRRNRYNR